MSKKWKYQMKFGFFFGFLMTVINVLFKIKEVSFLEQIAKIDLYIYFIAHTVVATFILSHYFGKQNLKKNQQTIKQKP